MSTAGRSSEFPGFQVPGSPVFNHADGTTMFTGEFTEPAALLDFAMVFGSRLWGHEPIGTLGLTDDADGASYSELGIQLTEAATPGTGDLYTHELREQANDALCLRVALELEEPADAWRSLILHTGSEAVETALKTALRATGRTRLHAFEGGYHGTFGLALAVTHRPEFREPWADQYAGTCSWSPWGEVPTLDEQVAAVVVEPWQGRAGVIPPPDGFLDGLRAECDRVGAVLVLDAVLCGAGRTGPVIASRIAEVQPDIVCLGKAIGCGAVASAVVARAELADAAWDRGPVEPAHTSTSLGDPLAAA
ncbi:MAG: Acetylornithine aminotransferase, partial [Thermoleophilia bacterium]|nr:Acetylornithine aminotransferase [Thermoleophilia bacterium]